MYLNYSFPFVKLLQQASTSGARIYHLLFITRDLLFFYLKFKTFPTILCKYVLIYYQLKYFMYIVTAQLLLYTQPGSLHLLYPSSLGDMAGKMTCFTGSAKCIFKSLRASTYKKQKCQCACLLKWSLSL